MYCKNNMKLFVFSSLLMLANGFPVAEFSPERGTEKVYPNGTVLGQYQYTDKDGNPVQVKYFADDFNYGVELNSVKVISGAQSSTSVKTTPKPNKIGAETILENLLNSPSFSKKYKARDPITEFLNKESSKSRYRHNPKLSPDYETYMLNSLDMKHCNKDKVKVYNMEPEQRKIRKALDKL